MSCQPTLKTLLPNESKNMSKSYHKIHTSQVKIQKNNIILGQRSSNKKIIRFIIKCLTSTLSTLNKTELETLNLLVYFDNNLHFNFMSQAKLASYLKKHGISRMQLSRILKKLKFLLLIDVTSIEYNTSLYNVSMFFSIPEVRKELSKFLPALNVEISRIPLTNKETKKALQYYDQIIEKVRYLAEENVTPIICIEKYANQKESLKNVTPILKEHSLYIKNIYLSINSIIGVNIYNIINQFTICKRELKLCDLEIAEKENINLQQHLSNSVNKNDNQLKVEYENRQVECVQKQVFTPEIENKEIDRYNNKGDKKIELIEKVKNLFTNNIEHNNIDSCLKYLDNQVIEIAISRYERGMSWIKFFAMLLPIKRELEKDPKKGKDSNELLRKQSNTFILGEAHDF